MRLERGILGIMIILFIGISFEQAWAQDSESFGRCLFDEPFSFFQSDGKGFVFLLFIIGIAIYSLFVWHFYRFISKRDLFPKLFYVFSERKEENLSIAKRIGFGSAYVVAFPFMIFIWFTVLAFFVFLISQEMPFEIAIFVSMAIIGVVRILSYYREEAAKEVAKMIPYAILSFLLTSAAVYASPNFFTEKALGSIPEQFIENFEGIIAAILIISIFEYSFRVAFIVKRKFLPVSDKKLEEEIESEVEGIAKAHFKKMEDKEKQLEKKLEEMLKKIKESEKI
jgi:hypothetical protein